MSAVECCLRMLIRRLYSPSTGRIASGDSRHDGGASPNAGRRGQEPGAERERVAAAAVAGAGGAATNGQQRVASECRLMLRESLLHFLFFFSAEPV